MTDLNRIPGLARLRGRTTGDDRIRIALIDGPVDREHLALSGARLDVLTGVWAAESADSRPGAHGTAVASIIFGQPDTQVVGVAPGCRGLSVPAFSARREKTSQLELARGIELAVESGAHVINISGGQLSSSGEADDPLGRAVRLCAQENVLVIAAAGNDGCACQHVPASLPSVLAVGALDESGRPLPMSNWGPAYREQGLMAPGENLLTAVPGGGTARRTGTSLAAPVVAGVAALLLCEQLRLKARPDPLGVRRILLESARPCQSHGNEDCERYLAGVLDIEGALTALTTELSAPVVLTPPVIPSLQPESVVLSGGDDCGCPAAPSAPAPQVSVPQVTLSAAPEEPGSHLVYALGTLGYDFGSEARRDSFKQLMAPVLIEGVAVPANPYDARQMVDHLRANPSEANALIWTLNLELTPIYALEPSGPYAADIYDLLIRLLAGEVDAQEADDFIERVAVPGVMSGQTAKLFSGQVVPLLDLKQRRGLYGWEVNRLVAGATQIAVSQPGETAPPEAVATSLRDFLSRIYYDLRNLGATSRDRALNFAATNAFQAAQTFASALAMGQVLDSIAVEKSPFGRQDSDCWDVRLRFFDPENSRRAKRVFRFTIDVSDVQPVTLGEVRSWPEA
ncbi:PatA/PatG family cyanobactin maturation protease [Kineosporia sp. NBRC 101731]|uniref:PatA/PatG family cyanobactin maturation protease n=1 Tax=Kineosporia sp. NBRC 101731 TaxID=3032199 RepID=UPI0024A1C72D|nr:PatA/PatG family cyanobactin maturation protease [Kineosporia sp. NBRC 101731]GLY30750.1 protease [Kineosporia sp. NBRC 101731]